MSKTFKTITNYRISDRNGSEKGIYSPEIHKMIIGVPYNFNVDSVDAELIFDTQTIAIDIPDYFNKLFKFSKDKRETIEKAVKFLINNDKYKIHMGKNLESVINYAFNHENRYLSKLVKTLFEISDEEDLTYKIATINKMLTTAKFRSESKILSGYICAYNLINPSFAEKGTGYLYVINTELSYDEKVKIDNNYKECLKQIYNNTLERIYKSEGNYKIDNIDEIYNVERCLNEKLGLKGKYEKWEIQTMYKYIHFDKNYSGLIQAMMKE